MTPRPSSRRRSSSSAVSTLAFSESVACCSSRSLRGRWEANRMASSAAARALTGGSRPGLDLDRARGRREREGLGRRPLHQALRHLAVGAVLRQAPADVLLPAEQVLLLVGGLLAGEQAYRLQEEQAGRHPEEICHLFGVRL